MELGLERINQEHIQLKTPRKKQLQLFDESSPTKHLKYTPQYLKALIITIVVLVIILIIVPVLRIPIGVPRLRPIPSTSPRHQRRLTLLHHNDVPLDRNEWQIRFARTVELHSSECRHRR